MKVKVNTKELNMRMGPGKIYPVNGQVHQGDTFTIVEEKNGFGLLKSHAGWIDLSFCNREG